MVPINSANGRCRGIQVFVPLNAVPTFSRARDRGRWAAPLLFLFYSIFRFSLFALLKMKNKKGLAHLASRFLAPPGIALCLCLLFTGPPSFPPLLELSPSPLNPRQSPNTSLPYVLTLLSDPPPFAPFYSRAPSQITTTIPNTTQRS